MPLPARIYRAPRYRAPASRQYTRYGLLQICSDPVTGLRRLWNSRCLSFRLLSRIGGSLVVQVGNFSTHTGETYSQKPWKSWHPSFFGLHFSLALVPDRDPLRHIALPLDRYRNRDRYRV